MLIAFGHRRFSKNLNDSTRLRTRTMDSSRHDNQGTIEFLKPSFTMHDLLGLRYFFPLDDCFNYLAGVQISTYIRSTLPQVISSSP